MNTNRFAFSSTTKCWIPRLALALLILTLAGVPGRADKVITNDGRTLEGLLKDENPYYISIDVKGIVSLVPQERVKKVLRNSRQENLRSLLDRAVDALSRNDIGTARTLVDQAKGLNVSDPTLVDSLSKTDQEISELERSGGTPEEQRQRSEALLKRANEAYDKIRIEEGNQLLLKALEVDPKYDAAHLRMGQLLSQHQPDLMLAAEYYTRILAPNSSVRTDSPIIPLLPGIYANVAGQFEHSDSADPRKSAQYVKMLKTLFDGFANHPSWKDSANAETKAQLAKPVDELLAALIRNNLKNGSFQVALAKLQGWSPADTSADTAMLYVRAEVGAKQFSNALKVLDEAMLKFTEAQDLRPQSNAIKLLVQAQESLEQKNQAAALTTYETIFGSRENLVPEIGETVGRQLAKLRAPDMETALVGGGFRAADIAALVVRFGQDPAQKRRAAEIMVSSIQAVPWRLELNWSVGGSKVTLPEPLTEAATKALSQPLAVRFDQQSPFVLRLFIDAQVPGKAEEVAQSLNAGQTLAKPVPVTGMRMMLVATHSTLGQIYKASWSPAALSAVPVATPATTPAPAVATAPMPGGPGMPPGMMPGGPGGPGMPPPGAPPVATPSPAPTPTPTPAAKPAAPGEATSGWLVLKSMDSIREFIGQTQTPQCLVKYLSPDVTLLPAHLSVPLAQDILRESEVPAGQ